MHQKGIQVFSKCAFPKISLVGFSEFRDSHTCDTACSYKSFPFHVAQYSPYQEVHYFYVMYPFVFGLHVKEGLCGRSGNS